MFFKTKAANRAFVVCAVVGLLTLAFIIVHGLAFHNKQIPFGLYNAFVLIAFSTLLTETYFTKPNDVVANSTALLVLLVPLAPFVTQYYPALILICCVASVALVAAILANSLFDPTAALSSQKQRFSRWLKSVAIRLGSGRALFSATAVLLLLNEKHASNGYFVAGILYVFCFLAFDVAKLVDSVRKIDRVARPTGEVIGVRGDNLVVGRGAGLGVRIGQTGRVRLPDGTFGCRVISHHRLADELRTLLVLAAPIAEATDLAQGRFILEDDDLESATVGLVNELSSVPLLRFRQLPGSTLEIGNIVSCEVGESTVYYQIQDAKLVERTTSSENATDFAEVFAAQIGRWNRENGSFERSGWLPKIYSDVDRPSTFPTPIKLPDEFQIGSIPGTDVPVFLNTREAITHHTAVLGVTGVGKSVFVRNLIKTIASEQAKFICVDLTREYIGKFPGVGSLLVKEEQQKLISRHINALGRELAKFRSQQSDEVLNDLRAKVVAEFKAAIANFIAAPERQIGILELGDLDGSLENLEYLRWFFRSLFLYAREREIKEPQICLVLEEAHTIVPEWNFMGSDDRSAGNVVNSIAQVALQGRKYGVGLVVVAQRTANVSKTVLTQCNTVIAFQQFDRTSFDFLESFVGGDAARILPNLKPRTAIATGKGIRSTTPLIFEVPELDV